MNDKLIIHDATLADLDPVSSLHCRCWQHAYRGVLDQDYLDALTPEMFAKYHTPRLTTPSPDEPFLVAADATGALQAFTRAGPTRQKSPTGDPLPGEPHNRYSAEIFAIYVAPELIGRGLGWRMWNETLDRLRQREHQSFCVWVLLDNKQGRQFYERIAGVMGEESEITLRGKAYRQVLYG